MKTQQRKKSNKVVRQAKNEANNIMVTIGLVMLALVTMFVAPFLGTLSILVF